MQQRVQQQFLDMMKQIPDDIARLAHEQQLGTPQARYMITKLHRNWFWLRFVILYPFLLLMMILITLSIVIIAVPMNFSFTFMILPLLLISLMAFYILLIGCIVALALTQKTCSLYPCDNGLILKQSASKFRVIRWEEIETVWQASARAFPSTLFRGRLYTIRCHDSYTLTFMNHVRRLLDDLDQVFEAQFTRRRLPFYFADYQAGRTLDFGLVKVNREGIVVREKMLPWEQVADISLLKRQRLVVSKVGERPEIWMKLPAFKIPNLSILLALFQRIRSGQGEQEAGPQAIYGEGATVVSAGRKIDPLPDGLVALAEEHRLGERRVDQKLGRSLLTSWSAIVGLLVVDAIGGIAAIVTWRMFFSSLFGPIWNSPTTPFFLEFALLFFLMILFATITIIRSVRQIHNYTYTFEHGMILKWGKQDPVAFRWEDVETVWRIPSFAINRRQQPIMAPGTYASTLQLRDGTRYTLTPLNIDQQALGKIIEEQIVRLQLPATIDAYQADQPLCFGQVQVSRQGITVGERLLPWSQVKSVSLQENRLVVYDIAQRKPWCKLPAKRVPNLFLLFALADYARSISE
ncbi:MAG TPA: DUF6585 family protein [Ktedonobacteraceae bacterium]|nr:DUF6585 family protein [Ktedonobacteraceae bacterium]